MRRWHSIFRRTGILDGLWTLAASLGSKLQILVLLAVASRSFGIEGAAQTVLATSAGALAFALIDWGLSTQATRAFANGSAHDKRTVIAPYLRRIAIYVPVVGVLAVLFIARVVPENDLLWWYLAVLAYAASIQASTIATQVAYGCARFRSGATINGLVRSGTIPVMLVGGLLQSPLFSLIALLAAGELTIAVLQYVRIPGGATHGPEEAAQFRLVNTWRFGVGSIANTIMNRSDSVAVSAVATSVVIGVYGLASQIENALTTAALIPAGAVVAYTARATSRREARDVGRTTAAVVGLIYVCAAVPFIIFTEPFISAIFGVRINDPLPFQICAVAGLFSCLGGVAMQQLIGVGNQSAVAIVWLVTAPIAIAFLLTGTLLFGAVGTAFGALARDILFFVLTWAARAKSGHLERRVKPT